jgi:hypothetical protein
MARQRSNFKHFLPGPSLRAEATTRKGASAAGSLRSLFWNLEVKLLFLATFLHDNGDALAHTAGEELLKAAK